MTTVKVLVAQEIMESLFTRDHLGNRLSVEWRDTDTYGFHEPIITVDYTDNLVAARNAEIAKAVRGLMAKTTKRSDPNAALAAVLALLYPKP